ncbi:Nucleolar protein [Dirofilaria immitis]
MRSQKQVRRAVKVRSLKNAAAGKWKTYRKCLEDRKAWQNNAILTRHQHSSSTLAPPPPKHRRIKEPKQRSPEKLAERQRLREQRRLEKKLAKQRASTSTLPEIKKEKKLKEISNTDSPKNVSAERKTNAKSTTVKNSMVKEMAKRKRLMNEQTQRMANVTNQKVAAKKLNELKAMKVPKLQNELESKRQYLKEERLPVSEQKISQSSTPMKIERKELMKSKNQTIGGNKIGKKLSEEKKEQIKEIDKKARNDKMKSSIPAPTIESQEPVDQTVLNSLSKKTEKDLLMGSDVVDSAEIGSTQEFLKEKAEKKGRGILRSEQIGNKDEQTEVHASIKKVEAINKERKTKKRNRQLDTNIFLADVKDDIREKDNKEADANVAEIVEQEKKKKEGNHDEQQSKSVDCNNKDVFSVSDFGIDGKSISEFPKIQMDYVTDYEAFRQQKQQQSSENDSDVFTKNSMLSCNLAKSKNEIKTNEDLCNRVEVGQEFGKDDIVLANEDSKRSELKTEEISGIRSQQNGQKSENDIEWKYFIDENLHHNNVDQIKFQRESDESMPNKFISEDDTDHIEEFLTKEIDESMHIKELLSKEDELIARDDHKDEATESVSGFANLINAECAAENGCTDILHAGIIESTRFDVNEENLPHVTEKDVVEKISKSSDEQKRIALESDLDGNIVVRADAKVDIEDEKSDQMKIDDRLLSASVNAAVSLINSKNLRNGMNDQAKKQEKDITEKKEKKELDETVAHLTENQSYALENTEFKIEKIMDHILLSDGKISKDSETLSKTEMKMKAFIPEELEMKMEKLAEKHPEALDATNLNLSDNIIEDVSVASFAKEAKYDVNVEKKGRNAPMLQKDGVGRVTRERIYKLLPRDIQFCVHMIEEHGENYEAMANDQGNIFRDSAKGIARRIRIFKESPQYEVYLKQKVEKNGAVA